MRALALAACLAACGGDVALDAATDAAGIAPDAGPDAAPADAGLDAGPTFGVLVGDSIVESVFLSPPALAVLESDGDTIVCVAKSGDGTTGQLAKWKLSPYRGDPRVRWIFVQIGVNDVNTNAPVFTVAEIEANYTALLDDLRDANPDAALLIGVMTPARYYLDHNYSPSHYPKWLEVRDWQYTVGARPELAAALASTTAYPSGQDGPDYLAEAYYGDGLHLNAAGKLKSAELILGWIQEKGRTP